MKIYNKGKTFAGGLRGNEGWTLSMTDIRKQMKGSEASLQDASVTGGKLELQLSV